MYITIEQQFRNRSEALKNQIIFLISVFLLLAFETLIVYFFVPTLKGFFIVAICGDVVFYLCCYLYMIISNWKFISKPWTKVFDIDYNISEFHKRLQQKDLLVLKEIIENNKVNTRFEIQELIRHYQCFLPRTINHSGVTLSIMTLVISIWALLYKVSVDEALYNLFLMIIVTVIILILYWISLILYNNWFKIFGKNALYSRLEAALTEIYVNYPIAKRKSKAEK